MATGIPLPVQAKAPAEQHTASLLLRGGGPAPDAWQRAGQPAAQGSQVGEEAVRLGPGGARVVTIVLTGGASLLAIHHPWPNLKMGGEGEVRPMQAAPATLPARNQAHAHGWSTCRGR